MKNPAVREMHYGEEVWVNKEMDDLRRNECLCLNCTKMLICDIAKILYGTARLANVATAVTRCPIYEPKS